MKSDFIRSSLSALALCVAGTALADEVKLNFEGIGDQAPIGDYYNASSGINALGVKFVGAEPALAILKASAGGKGNVSGNPSGNAVMYFEDLDTDPDTVPLLQYANGFKDGFSFYYSAINFSGTVTYYSDVDGTTANKIGEMVLDLLPKCDAVPGLIGNFCSWDQVFVPLAAGVTVRSIRFGGDGDQIAFDDVILGVAAPVNPQVPEPATLALVGIALLGAAAARRSKV